LRSEPNESTFRAMKSLPQTFVYLVFLSLSFSFIAPLAFAGQTGTFTTDCQAGTDPLIHDSTDREMVIEAGVFHYVARFYSASGCKKLNAVYFEDGLIDFRENINGSTRTTTNLFARATQIDPSALVENGGAYYYRKLSNPPDSLRNESASIPKPFFYEAYGVAAVLNSIYEITNVRWGQFEYRRQVFHEVHESHGARSANPTPKARQ
jgi:hypothetical protein